jgi:hypothetical protein
MIVLAKASSKLLFCTSLLGCQVSGDADYLPMLEIGPTLFSPWSVPSLSYAYYTVEWEPFWRKS